MPIKKAMAGCLLMVSLMAASCVGKHPETISRADPVKTQERSENPADKIFECTGTFEILNSGLIFVSPTCSGVVKQFFFAAGSLIQAGSMVATIENMEFLKLQQAYLETRSQYAYFREDLKRQGELTIENASSVKKMQQAQMDFETCEIRLHSLASQLTLSGFTPDSVNVDHLSSLIQVRAPVTGYIHAISVRPGKSISPGQSLFSMVQQYQRALILDIHEKYFRDVKTGQTFKYYLPGDSTVGFNARLTFIYEQVDPANHMVKARAIPLDASGDFIPGMQVRARFRIID